MKDKGIIKLLSAVWPLTLLFGCKSSPFMLEPPDRTNLIHLESGLYVHREVELRVNAARLESPSDNAAPGAVSELATSRYFALGTGSTNFIRTQYERVGDDLVWSQAEHVSKDDLKGKTSLGAQVRWEKEGSTTAYDVLEIFRYPLPDVSQIDTWSPWIEAGSSREGSFGWHAEANKHPEETPPAPPHPFQMRFRLVLSKLMYP